MFIDKYRFVSGAEINISPFVYRAAIENRIDMDIIISEESKRLDHYAFEYYNEPNNWWIIAAASGIGWWLQVPAGTVLRIPTDLSQISEIKDRI